MLEDKKHIFQYDLMRFFFMLMTLGVHVCANTMVKNNVWMTFDNFFIICNPLFFMLSGKLNLSKKFDKKNDYIEYYIKRIKTIIIPFFLLSVLLQFIKYGSLHGFLGNLISGNIEETYWFVYVLIGIMILSPFYSKMLQSMKKNEKKYFLIICILANFFIMLLDFFNIKTAIGLSTIGIVTWHFYYFSGYIIEDLFQEKKNRIFVYILGVLSFILVIFINSNIRYYYNFKEPGIFLTFQAFAIYLAVRNMKVIKNDKIKSIITFISKYSYTFYLVHMFVLNNVIKNVINYINIYNNLIAIIAVYIVTFIITLCLSIIIQNLITLIQKIFDKFVLTIKNRKKVENNE